MSRIGKLPVEIPAGVTITVGDKEITVAGPKGTLQVPVQENWSKRHASGSCSGKYHDESRG